MPKRTAFTRICSGALLAILCVAHASSAAQAPLADARAAAGSVDGAMAVYARAMDGRPPLVAYRADEMFPSASIIKVLIMATAFAAAVREPGLLQRAVTVHASDMVGGSEFLANVIPGQRFAMSTLIYYMITQSDNTASNALISYFGFDRINAAAHRFGMKHTVLKRHFLDYTAIVKHNENMTSAADMGRLLYQIERGAREALTTVASPGGCRRMIAIMLGQEDRDKIPAGLPKGVRVANKTGEITGVRSDVAIVDPYGDNPYVIAILTKNLDDYSVGLAAIRRVSRDLYQSMSQ